MTAPPREAVDALLALYAEFDERTSAVSPVCRASGRCCDFDAFGHTLFSSRLEAEVLAARAGGLPPETPGYCPWWVERRCTARSPRPLGCRAFFCDREKEDAMAALHEEALRELKALHEKHGLSWDYAPLLRHLGDLRQEVGDDGTGDAP